MWSVFRMETTRCALIFLVSVCLWRTSCTSSIKLCTDSPTSFGNGTAIPAILGEPVSVVFCVQCDPRLYISKYIQIQHPNYATDGIYYYTNNNDMWRPIIVNITSSANNTTIIITIKTVKKEDFTDTFSVIINTNKGVDDKELFSFHLTETVASDTSTSDASLFPSTNPKMPAVISIRTSPATSSTELSTVSSQASTESTSTSRPTKEITQCRPLKTSQCPENWYQVDNETCLLVTQVSHNKSPRDVCYNHSSEPVKKENITKLSSCLFNILQELMPEPINYEVLLENGVYVNVQNQANARQTSYTNKNVACFQKKENFKSPTVSTFSLTTGRSNTILSYVNSSNYNVTVKTTNASFLFTCNAEGMPTPHVIITSESGDQITPNKWLKLAVCSVAGAYTCTASNFLGTAQAHTRIHILNSFKLSHFTLKNTWNTLIQSGETVHLSCSVEGCPDSVTIKRNEHTIAETANFTLTLGHKITRVNCSHMGTYTCLAKSLTGQVVQETAELEVKGCPVSLCESEDASREMSPALGGEVTFTLCLMSSEMFKSSRNDTKIMVAIPKTPINRIYWTVNITMYNIKAEDYRTHTVRIENRYGSLDVHFTLTCEGNTPGGQKAQGQGAESSVLLIALPPVCFIILVLVIVGIVWYRVKGTRISKTRSEEAIDHGSGNDDSGEAMYANVKDTAVGRVRQEPEAEHQQEVDRIQCQEESNTIDLYDQESGRFITSDGLVYITVVNANKEINKRSQRGKHPSKQKCDDGGRVEYLTLDFEKTGKLLVADEEDNKDDDSGDKNDTQQ